MVSSALLNFIIFIKLMYTSQCGHLIKTFPRALCRLLNEAGAAGLRFRASWGGEVAERDLNGGPGFPPRPGPGLSVTAPPSFRPSDCRGAQWALQGFLGRGCAVAPRA